YRAAGGRLQRVHRAGAAGQGGGPHRRVGAGAAGGHRGGLAARGRGRARPGGDAGGGRPRRWRERAPGAGAAERPARGRRGARGAARTAEWARERLADTAGFWLHVDVDVLDPAVMPAVDAPGDGGIAHRELELLIAGLVAGGGCVGVEITVFDPDHDPDGTY